MSEEQKNKEIEKSLLRGKVLEINKEERCFLVSLINADKEESDEEVLDKKLLTNDETLLYKIEIELDEDNNLVSESEKEDISFEDVSAGDDFVAMSNEYSGSDDQKDKEVESIILSQFIIITKKTDN